MGLGLVALAAGRSAIPAVAQNIGRILDQLRILRRLDRRVSLGRIALRLANRVDPVQRLRVFRLAHEHQIVVITEDIPDLVDPATNQLNLVLEVLPLGRSRRDSRAALCGGASRPNLNQGYELHHRDHLQPGETGCQLYRQGDYNAIGGLTNRAKCTLDNPRRPGKLMQ